MPVAKRIKKREIPAVTTREEFINKMDRIASLVVNYHKLEAEAQSEHQKVDEKYGYELRAKESEIYALRDATEKYFLEHKSELCKPGLKEGESSLARFGIRLGLPTVAKTVKTAWKVLAVDFASRPNLSEFVRSTPEIDKDKILAIFRDDSSLTRQNMLLKNGITVEQKEEFWVKAKAEEQV